MTGSSNGAVMFSGIIFAGAILGAKLVAAADLEYCAASPFDAFFDTEEGTVCHPMTGLEPRPENHPWTHVVQCMETPDDNYGKAQTFCLYTRPASGSRHECSFVTTPELARALTLENAIIEHGEEAKASISNRNSSFPLYQTRHMKARGVSTFATADIEAGQVIFADSPIFITLRDALDFLPRTGRQEMQWRGVLQLSADVQRLFRNLSKSRGGDEIDDILQTNALGLSLGGNHGYLALMPQVAVRPPIS